MLLKPLPKSLPGLELTSPRLSLFTTEMLEFQTMLSLAAWTSTKLHVRLQRRLPRSMRPYLQEELFRREPLEVEYASRRRSKKN